MVEKIALCLYKGGSLKHYHLLIKLRFDIRLENLLELKKLFFKFG